MELDQEWSVAAFVELEHFLMQDGCAHLSVTGPGNKDNFEMEIKTQFLQCLDLSLPWDVGVDGNICKLAFLCYIFPENIRFEIKTVWRTPTKIMQVWTKLLLP